MNDIVDELLRAWLTEFPDPVDSFEDDLARRLGVARHPGLEQSAWRVIRRAAIEQSTDEPSAVPQDQERP